MSIKKMVSLLLCCLLVPTLFACTGKGTSEMDTSFTVEDTKAFVVEQLVHLNVLITPDNEYPKVQLDNSDIYIDYNDLARTLHVYELAVAKESEVVLTADEVIDLYDNWDAQKGERLEYMGDWHSMNGRWQHSQYTGGMNTAAFIREQNGGENLNPYSCTLEELLELEEYTIQNPVLDSDDNDYQQLLIWLGVVEVEAVSQ